MGIVVFVSMSSFKSAFVTNTHLCHPLIYTGFRGEDSSAETVIHFLIFHMIP